MQFFSDKLIFLGDLHLHHANISSRRDEYGETVLAKLRWVFEESLRRDCKLVVCSGDWFHTKKQTVPYLSKVVSLFNEFKSKGVYITGPWGNHDVLYEREDTISQMPISILSESNLVHHLDTLEIFDGRNNLLSVVQGCDYTQNCFPLKMRNDVLSFLVGHRYYEQGEHDPYPLTKEIALNLGYDFYLFGHDHICYEDICLLNPNSFSSSSSVIRPGSLTRGSSHEHQLNRKVEIVFFEFSDPKNPTFEHVEVPIAPATEVFISQVFTKEDSAKLTKEGVKKKVENLISIFESSKSGSALTLDYEGIPSKVRVYIEEKLREKGVFADK